MKFRTFSFGGFAFVASLGMHFAGFAALPDNNQIKQEGGAPVQLAALGNSFFDMVQGVKSVEPTNDLVDPKLEAVADEPDETHDTIEPTELGEPQEIVERAYSQVQPPGKTEQLPEPTISTAVEAVANTINPVVPTPLETTKTPNLSAIVISPIIGSPIVTPLRSVTETEIKVEKAVAVEVIEVIISVSKQKSIAKPQPQTKPRPKPILRTKPRKPKTQPVVKPQKARRTPVGITQKGNSNQQARKGQASGTAKGRVARSSTLKRAGSKEGNAAASNYPGKVMRRISRTRKERAGGRGRAVVGFSISASGAPISVRILQSSGSQKIDKIALRHIRRSAPFPRPPKGAQRKFRVTFVAKR